MTRIRWRCPWRPRTAWRSPVQHDALGRSSGFTLDDDYTVSYAYDMFGRFHSVSSSVPSAISVATYSYLPGSDLVSGMTSSSGFLWTRAYESARSLITSVENRFGATVISRYDYTNDEIGRRTRRADSGLAFAAQPTYGNTATAPMPAYNAYSYNTRSEVTGAARRWGSPDAPGALVLGQQYAYEFDSIGNRVAATEGDTSRIATYTANALNQYTQRTVPDEKDVIGTTPTNVSVTVNQNSVSRQSAYWHHALEVDNATDAAYPQVDILAVYNPPGTNDPDVVASATGHVFVAKTPEQFTYDDDGNLTQDGRFTYTWNGENRLIKAETRDDLPPAVPRVRVEYAYDHKGRMVWKQISTNAVIVSTRTLFWDGYNIIGDARTAYTNWFVWGMDLSGSLQGAGGVGGLLAEIQNDAPYLAAFDANGNVTEYVSTNGITVAHYEYSPFGEIVVQSGNMADIFTHRFSTKPWCAVMGLSEYEFRKYRPGIGRWFSRDPIRHLYYSGLFVFVNNAPVNTADYIGLYTLVFQGKWSEEQKKTIQDAFSRLQVQISGKIGNLEEARSIIDRCSDACGDGRLSVLNGAINKLVNCAKQIEQALSGHEKLRLKTGYIDGDIAAYEGFYDKIIFGTDPTYGYFAETHKVGQLYHELYHREIGWTEDGGELDSAKEPWLNAYRVKTMFDPGEMIVAFLLREIFPYYLNMINNANTKQCCEKCLKDALRDWGK